MTPDELRARLKGLAIRQRRAERRKEWDEAAELEAQYLAIQPDFEAMLDAVDAEQMRLEEAG